MRKDSPKPDNNSIAELFNLRRDLDDPDEIDGSVRAGVDVAGTNLWVLFFAILVASVGLNVNSTAVIIGAMLISPLMGPIVGVGYGLAVHDMRLIRRALRNLAIFTAISLVTSTLYFTISPLRVAGTELLARTTPNLWDVLIAFFGGSAGILALTRRSISNVIPGVAIATALMPPLCTVGFGLSKGSWAFAGGAFYLFLINGVFIAFSTFVFVKLIRLPLRGLVSDSTQLRARMFTTLTVIGVLLPSAYLAWRFVQEQRFITAATEQVEALSRDSRYILLDREIDPTTRTIRLTISGDKREDKLGREIAERLQGKGFANADVAVRFSGTDPVNVNNLKQELRADVLQQVSREADSLRSRVQELQDENEKLRGAMPDYAQLIAELKAQYPAAHEVAIGLGAESAASAPAPVTLVRITQRQAESKSDRERIERWLAVRLPGREVRVNYSIER